MSVMHAVMRPIVSLEVEDNLFDPLNHALGGCIAARDRVRVIINFGLSQRENTEVWRAIIKLGEFVSHQSKGRVNRAQFQVRLLSVPNLISGIFAVTNKPKLGLERDFENASGAFVHSAGWSIGGLQAGGGVQPAGQLAQPFKRSLPFRLLPYPFGCLQEFIERQTFDEVFLCRKFEAAMEVIGIRRFQWMYTFPELSYPGLGLRDATLRNADTPKEIMSIAPKAVVLIMFR